MERRLKEKLISEMKNVFKDVEYGIEHTFRVLNNAEEISNMSEGLDSKTKDTIEIVAILHDIGAIEAYKKYNSLQGKYQEIEGPDIAKKILMNHKIDEKIIERVCYIVGNHHTKSKINGIDFEILWEADLIDNIEFGEKKYEKNEIYKIIEENIITKSGKELATRKLLKEGNDDEVK